MGQTVEGHRTSLNTDLLQLHVQIRSRIPSVLSVMDLHLQSLGSLLVTIMFLRSMILEFVPQRLLSSVKKAVKARLLPHQDCSIVIEEFDYRGYSETFELALKYLSIRFSDSASAVRVADDGASSKGYSFAIDIDQTLVDEANGVAILWSFRVKDSPSLGRGGSNRVRYLELSFGKEHNGYVRHRYFLEMLAVARQEEACTRARKLFTNSSSGDRGSLWSSVVFDHPSTFDTLAMDHEVKMSIINDLKKFTNKEDYYKRVGRTWKRGYLIYGPPGTGKTSLVAAMANFLEFDLYDLDLSAVTSNSQLRRLLLETRRRSLIVIEDIDRCIHAVERYNRRLAEHGSSNGTIRLGDLESDDDDRSGTGELSLSGILNFMDGLWSSCGQERLMVVTTNHKDRLDRALLRPGRLDVHIHLSYCRVHALRTLANNYLFAGEEKEDEGHSAYAGAEWREIEELIVKVNVTPATVAETFLGSGNPTAACAQLADMLRREFTGKCKKREEEPASHSQSEL